jgi:hypothetical protein
MKSTKGHIRFVVQRALCGMLAALGALLSCAAQEGAPPAPMPAGYGDITLGMSFDEVSAALTANPAYGYKGEPDVSLFQSPNRTLIETAGPRNSVFQRSWFHFYEDKLYIILLALNSTQTDHYSLFSTLRAKYGDPQTLNPEKSVWEDGAVTLSLERPLTLRYVDAPVFRQLAEAAGVEQSTAEYLREQFLEGL